MSPFSFSDNAIKLLSKGFSFTPTPPSNNLKTLVEIEEFTRRLRLKEFFHGKESKEKLGHVKSTWTPDQGRNKELDNNV